MDTAIAIVGILLGLVFCLCGYAAHRLWCACNGMLLGVSGGSLLGMQLQSPVFMVVCGALLGLGLAVVFFRFERIGSAVSLAVTGFACGLLILRSFDSTAWPWALLAAGVGAGVSWLRPRPAGADRAGAQRFAAAGDVPVRRLYEALLVCIRSGDAFGGGGDGGFSLLQRPADGGGRAGPAGGAAQAPGRWGTGGADA